MKKYLGLEDISNVNCSSVLNVIKEAGEISRKAISDETGLSWAGMTKIVNKLFERGFLEERRSEVNAYGVGRIPQLISIRKDKNVIIGLDINREGFRGCVINLVGEILAEYSGEMEYSNKDELLNKIISFASGIVGRHSHQKILAIGVAMQGQLDVENGISREFPHCPDWKNVPIKEILQNYFHCKVYVEHDPNCILYARIHKGTTENCILFRIDRSIGMAVYIDGAILRGDGLLEVKHCIVVPNGKKCDSGSSGSLEAYVCDCLKNKQLNIEGVRDFVSPFAIFMYNASQIFKARKIILTGELIRYKNQFEKELTNEFVKYDKEHNREIFFMEDTKKVVYGAALIGAQFAIDDIGM